MSTAPALIQRDESIRGSVLSLGLPGNYCGFDALPIGLFPLA